MPHDCIELNLKRNRVQYYDMINKTDIKKKFKKKLAQFNNFFLTFGLSFEKVHCVYSKNRVSTDESNDFEFSIKEKSPKEDKIDFAKICQNARDKSCMSNRAYKIFREIIQPIANLATLESCVKYKKKVDDFWHLKTNSRGTFIAEPVDKISYICSKYIEQRDPPYEHKNITNKTFNILLCGDSFQLTKTHTNVLNFAFCLLNDGDMSHNGFYTLGLFKIKNEDYASIKECIEELIDKLNKIKEISIKSDQFYIKFTLGGDLKWLATTLGINSASSDYPCPWCPWKSITRSAQKESAAQKKKLNEQLFNGRWSINDRDHHTANQLFKQKTAAKRQGYLNPSLFRFIEFCDCVPDPLHLMLRISDKLFELLLFRLEELEKSEKSYNFNDKSTRILSLTFLEFLKNERTGCNLNEPYFYNETERKFKLRNLNSNERNIILTKIKNNSLVKMFPKKIQKDSFLINIEEILIEFHEIMRLIKIDYNKEDLKRNPLENKIKNWLGKLILVDLNITPYIHILCFHICDFIEKFHNLDLFSMNGLEKLNHIVKQNYFKQTNHRKNFTILLVKKMNRMEFIHLKGIINE